MIVSSRVRKGGRRMENLSSPMAADLAARVERERSAYDAGVDRERYQALLASHAGYQNGLARARIARAALAATPLRRGVGLGGDGRGGWVGEAGVAPGGGGWRHINPRGTDPRIPQ